MAEFHFPCDQLPYGDLFTEADTLEEAQENLIKYITSKVTLENISHSDPDSDPYELTRGEVIEEH